MKKLIFTLGLVFSACQHSDFQGSLKMEDFEHLASGNAVEMLLAGDHVGNATNYFLKAEMLAHDGQISKAESYYQLSYSLDPNAVIAEKLISTQLAQNKFSQAMKNLEKMILLYPKSMNLQLMMAKIIAPQSQLKAIEYTKRVTEIEPTYEPAYEQLFMLYHSVGQKTKARRVVDKMIRLFPGSAAAQTLLTKIYLDQRNFKKALIPAKRAYQLYATNTKVLLTYAFVLEMNQKKAEAVKVYSSFFYKSPDLDELLRRMLSLYSVFGSFSLVNERLDFILANTSRLGWSVGLQKVVVLWELKKDQEAVAQLDRLERHHLKSDLLSFMRAMTFARAQKDGVAVDLYLQIPVSSQYFLKARLQAVSLLRKNGDRPQAIKALQAVLKSNLKNTTLFILAADLYSQEGLHKKAVELMELAISNDVHDSNLLFFRGVYEEKAGEHSKCIATMKKVLLLNPMHSKAMNYLGYLYAERGENLNVAEELIERALSIEPENGSYLDSLGWVYYQRGNYHEALEVLQKAVERSPKEGIIHEHIGDVYVKLGSYPKAVQSYSKALSLLSDAKDKARIQRKLDHLKVSHGN